MPVIGMEYSLCVGRGIPLSYDTLLDIIHVLRNYEPPDGNR
jgi:hypothetical protein